jgi:hypothetical protein
LNTTEGAMSEEEVLRKVKERLATVNTVRKNGILAIEYLVTTSFDFETLQMSNDYLDAGQRWINEIHGPENVIYATRHRDESTFHLSAMVVPIDPKRKLNASHFLDGRVKLSQMQSDFFRQVGEPFGLERGVEGSTAKHTSIRDYYAMLNQPVPQPRAEVPDVPEPTHSEIVAESRGEETQHSLAVIAAAITKKKREAEINAQRQAEHAKAKHVELLSKQLAMEKKGISQLRAAGATARNLALELVLEKLGCQRETSEKSTMKWRTPVGTVTLNGSKFYANDLAFDGVGAVDLTKLIEDIDEESALRLLSTEFGMEQVTAEMVARVYESLKVKVEVAAAKPATAFQLPVPSLKEWPGVKVYLCNTWKFSEPFIDRLHQARQLYADQHANVVFVLSREVGVELHGTNERPFHGFRGQKARFELKHSDDKKVAIVETTLDAISLAELDFKGTVISLNENSESVAGNWANEFRSAGYQVITAFNNDRAGDSLASTFGPFCERLRPNLKNWQQDLQAGKDVAPVLAQSTDEDEDWEETNRQSDQWPRER